MDTLLVTIEGCIDDDPPAIVEYVIDAFLVKHGGQASRDDAPHAAVVCSHHDDQFRH